MGTLDTAGTDSSQMVPDKTIAFRHLALILILAIIFPTHASPLEPYKRGRSASSSLIPFPRVGRSVSEPLESNADSDNSNDDQNMLRSTRSSSQFYGQKRTVQKRQALIPFPRTGKRASLQPHKYQDDSLGQKLVAFSAMQGDSERYVYPREYETLQLIQSLLRELQNDK